MEEIKEEIPERKTGIHVVIDYYRASFDFMALDSDDEEIEVNEKVEEIALNLGVSSNEIHQRYISKEGYRYCYELGPYMVLYMCKPVPANHTNTCSLELRGKGCRDYEARNPNKTWLDFLRFMHFDLDSKASRIDIAIDDYEGKYVSMDWVRDKLLSKKFTSIFKKKVVVTHGSEEEGFSYSLGSRDSSGELCIYNKLLEQKIYKGKEVNQDYWVRYEMRFHRQKAYTVGLEMLAAFSGTLNEVTDKSGNEGFIAYAKSLLRGVIDIKVDNDYDLKHQSMVATDPKWIEFLDNQQEWKVKSSTEKERTWDTKLNSVKRVVAPYYLINYLLAEGNYYNFTTMILKDFLDVFEKLENKNQLKSLNTYTKELGLPDMDLIEINKIKNLLVEEIQERELPF